MRRIDLGGTWNFKALPAKRESDAIHDDVGNWLPATVPGTVHTDLLAAGKIPDPFYRMNEWDVQWVDAERWLYRREFAVGAEFLANEDIHLVAEGLDTFATIKLNAKPLGKTADMFVEHRFKVKQFLKVGTNVLEVLFESPTECAQQLEDRYGALQVSHEPRRVYARKAQYSFGWDWGPRLTTSGIWRPVYLEGFNSCRVKSVFARTTKVTKRSAKVLVDVEVEGSKGKSIKLIVQMKGEGFEYQHSFDLRNVRKSITINVPNPHLWWPNGYGSQSLYDVHVSTEVDGIECDSKKCSFGVRTIRLIQEKDKQGRSFIFEINGERIYCKGADWIPSDNFLPRISSSTYERLLTMARDANINMVRVWGGGIYEQDVFYDFCDRLGLLVWQDFMFACGEYPQQSWFLDQVKDEAHKAVTRLRNHPSIVLWCGNNECEWIFCQKNPGKKPDDMNGATIFRDVLPSICRQWDGSRPYWRSSPFGTGFPNNESDGNRHQWAVWGQWIDYPEYEKDAARFVTEFGFQAPAYSRTMASVTLPSDLHAQSKVMEHHNKLPEGTERLFRFQTSHFTVAADYEDFVYTSQLVQAEALKTATEHWRRRKFKTAGSMFWQLNDCWPVTSWSVIDSALRPKAAYFYAKQFYAPVLVSFRRTDSVIEVWGTNDLLKPLRGDLSITLRSFGGLEVSSSTKQVIIEENSSKILMKIAKADSDIVDCSQHYYHARLIVDRNTIFENRFYLCEPKHMTPQRSIPSCELTKQDNQHYLIALHSRSLAKNVYIDFDGDDVHIDDNYFDVDPGIIKSTTIRTSSPFESIQQKLKIRTLWGYGESVQHTGHKRGSV